MFLQSIFQNPANFISFSSKHRANSLSTLTPPVLSWSIRWLYPESFCWIRIGNTWTAFVEPSLVIPGQFLLNIHWRYLDGFRGTFTGNTWTAFVESSTVILGWCSLNSLWQYLDGVCWTLTGRTGWYLWILTSTKTAWILLQAVCVFSRVVPRSLLLVGWAVPCSSLVTTSLMLMVPWVWGTTWWPCQHTVYM